MLTEVGVEIDQEAVSPTGTVVWFEYKGSVQGNRPGLRRTDTLKKAIANGALLRALADRPTLVLLARGAAQQQAAEAEPIAGQRRIALPWLEQPEFDRALWSADLNFVRGEDSLVRAQWAGSPFVWQIYPQDDGVHARKLEAFIARFDAVAGPLAPAVWSLWRAWNGWRGWDAACASALEAGLQPAWAEAVRRWRETLAAEPDLVQRLQRFVASKR